MASSTPIAMLREIHGIIMGPSMGVVAQTSINEKGQETNKLG
jgi:hypothetical protein